MPYPNQKTIHVKKTIDSVNGYMQINNTSWLNAFKSLSKSSFGLYLYLSRFTHKNGQTWNLSRVDAMNELSICSRTYDYAVAELKEKGYLKQVKGNLYELDVDNIPNAINCDFDMDTQDIANKDENNCSIISNNITREEIINKEIKENNSPLDTSEDFEDWWFRKYCNDSQIFNK